jgi:hypothetical protein
VLRTNCDRYTAISTEINAGRPESPAEIGLVVSVGGIAGMGVTTPESSPRNAAYFKLLQATSSYFKPK